MSEIPTKLEKNGQHLLSLSPWRRRTRAPSNGCHGLGKEKSELILQPVLKLAPHLVLKPCLDA